jgi:hypothetical protein
MLEPPAIFILAVFQSDAMAHITSLAESQGYTRGIDPDVGPLEVDNDDRDMELAAPLPDMMAIDGRNGVVQLADPYMTKLYVDMYI